MGGIIGVAITAAISGLLMSLMVLGVKKISGLLMSLTMLGVKKFREWRQKGDEE